SARWIAPTATTVAEVLARLGLDARASESAIADGRVFVGRKRVTRGLAEVPAGAEVLVHAPREEIALPQPFVLHEGDGLLAVDKPAGVPTVPDVTGARGTLIDLAARAIGRRREQLHPTSRLDRDVSGVVIFATTPAAADALSRAREAGAYRRRYVAIAAGELPDRVRWTWSIDRARDPRLRRAVDPPQGKASATGARVVARSSVGRSAFSLLSLAPETGRTHQIRVHAAAAGAPLVGDRDYGGPARITAPTGKVIAVGRVALHCAWVEVDLPARESVAERPRHCMIRVVSPVPRELAELAQALGLGSFEEAIACGP
ncbi:MAG: RluA family pseudouridine synthase, partial [Deltaproteobacteria bacterium]|nr:RluA family pseudouridine synthase [Deltaproteobacteria bacterium]